MKFQIPRFLPRSLAAIATAIFATPGSAANATNMVSRINRYILASIAALAALLAFGLTDTARATVIGSTASLANAQSLTLNYTFTQGTHQDVWTKFVLATVGSGDSSLTMGDGGSSYPPTIHTSTTGKWGLSGNDYAQGNGYHYLATASAVAPAAGDVVYVKMHLDAAYPDYYSKKTISLWINPADTSSEAALGTPAVTFDHLPWPMGSMIYQYLSVTGNAVLSNVVVAGNLADFALTPTTTTVATSGTPALYGTPVTFTATIVPGSGTVVPTGSVQFWVGGSPLNAAETVTAGSGYNGTAATTTSALAITTITPHAITAVYTASGSFSGSTGNLTGGQAVHAPGATAGNSTVEASPSTQRADGFNTSTVTVTLRDAINAPIQGKTVMLARNGGTGGGTPTITATQDTTDAFGVATFAVKCDTTGLYYFEATDVSDSNLVITQKAPVTFTTNPAASASLSTVTASPASPSTVLANGTDSSTITVTVRESGGTLVAGRTVTLGSSRPTPDTIAPASGVSNISGVVTFTVKSTTAGASVFTATVDSVTVNETATVDFVWPTLFAHAGDDQALTPSSPTATLGGSPAATGGSGTYTTYSWSPSTGLSDASVANPTVTTTAATTTYTLTVTDSASFTATDMVVVTYGVPMPTYSIDIGTGTPRTGQAGGAYPQTGSWNKVALNGGGGSNTITVNNLVDGTGTVQTGVSFIFNDNNASYAYFSSATGACMSPDLGQNLHTTGNMNWKFTGLPANTSYTVWGAGWSGGFFAGPAIGTPGQPNGTKYPWGTPLTMTTDATGTLWGSWGDNVNFDYRLLDCMQIQEIGSALSGYSAWAGLHAGGATAAASDDYNNDGVANGIAYFMGMDGLATNPGVVNGKVTWPHVGTVASWEVQVSNDLVTWAPAAAGDIDTTSSPGNVIYTLPTGAPQKFCRLRVVP